MLVEMPVFGATPYLGVLMLLVFGDNMSNMWLIIASVSYGFAMDTIRSAYSPSWLIGYLLIAAILLKLRQLSRQKTYKVTVSKSYLLVVFTCLMFAVVALPRIGIRAYDSVIIVRYFFIQLISTAVVGYGFIKLVSADSLELK